MRTELHNLHGVGDREHEVYDMPQRGPERDRWDRVTNVACPVEGCNQTVLWYEAGYVPGYRVCMAPLPDVNGAYDIGTIRHRFLAGIAIGAGDTLIRDDCCEEEEEQ
jgi:hypothetical protein